jgi:hypothetical protein
VLISELSVNKSVQMALGALDVAGAMEDCGCHATLSRESLAGLSASTIFELRGEWRRLHRAPPPMRLSRDLLMRGITYKLQERPLGGLSKSIMRKLELLNLAGVISGRCMAGGPGFEPGLTQSESFIRIRLQSSSTTHPRARSPAVGSIASGFIPPNPFAVSPNEEERSALDAHAPATAPARTRKT